MSSNSREVTEPDGQRRTVWLSLAALIVFLGSLGAIFGSLAVARSDLQQSRQSFSTTSVEIASTLQLAIQHEQDLSFSAAAYVIENPHSSETSFIQWVNNEQAFKRYPEILAIAEVVVVPLHQLAAFARQANINARQSQAPLQTFSLTPPGKRPSYCLVEVELARRGLSVIPIGLDICSTALGPRLTQAANSGQAIYVPDSLGGPEAFAVGTPIYEGGSHPATMLARQAALIGWTGTEILPKKILERALLGHPGTSVAFHYKNGGSNVIFQAGVKPSSARSTTVSLHNGWHVQVFAASVSSNVFGNLNSWSLLFAGILLSLLVALLTYVLGTSRSRALHLVKERTDQLEHQALHDSLTGLPNRALILDRIEQMLSRARRQHLDVAALFLDLDNFKDINDTLGHRAGDELLASVGIRLTSAVRESDTVGRLGGDEFVILAEGESLEAGVDVVAGRIIDVLTSPFYIEASEVPLKVTASIGIAEGDRATPEALLQDADIALYQAKGAGKNRAVKFASSMQEAVDHHRHMAVDLQGALEANQFFIEYQPTVDLTNGSFAGVEALLRWRHPERGVVQPNDFIPALESSGLILQVGAWVLHEACRQGAIWLDRGHRFAVSVNMSGKQLERDRIINDVQNAITTSGFDPKELVLELTETSLMHDSSATLSRLLQLKSLGVRIAIDDFGTGYSSLAYLRQFPIDILKIDRSFVSGIADSTESAAIVHTLVQLGKVLGIETIAEGVETDDQRDRLESERVDIGQGFLFARPLVVEDLDRLLRESSGKPVWLSTAASRRDV